MGPVERGKLAQRLLDDETIKDLFAALEADYVKQWKDATVHEAREQAWFRVRALEDFKKELRRLRDSGTVAAQS